MLKKSLLRTVAGLMTAVCLVGGAILTGCASQGQSAQEGDGSTSLDKQISVYSREDGSGTRSAFVELFGLEEKDASGNKVDLTTDKASVTNFTSVMMTSIANDPYGIGYISLGSLNDTVKAVRINGVQAATDTVKDGSYEISRPFNIVTGEDVSPAAQDFISFIMSSDGQTIVEDNHYISVADTAAPYQKGDASGKVVVAGSSSVTPVMEKLAEAYQTLNPNVSIEVQQSDSTTGINMAKEGTCDIGMASRELKDSEMAAGLVAEAIARDGIAVIVAPESAVEDLTTDQVKAIFSGNALTWSEAVS